MNRFFILIAGLLLANTAAAAEPPNVVLIFLDDAGFADFHPFGDPPYETPNVQKLADEGGRYHNFFVPQAICSASRAALMTGCYPERTKMFGAHAPRERGLDPKWTTMGQVFQQAGYKTGWFGKWHLGDQEETRPHVRGFDETAGLMVSNDMWEHHPNDPETWGKHPLQYWSNGEVTFEPVTPEFQKSLTSRAAERSLDFIQRHKEAPFFLYVAPSMPHVPLFCSDRFEGKSGAGLYGDVILELDWMVGEIMTAIKENGLEEKTIVLFSSDNGPWSVYGDHAGQTPFRGSKATGFNGGTQSPLIIRYPGMIQAGTSSDAMFNSIDLLPTLCNLTGAALPDYEIDGKDVWPLLSGKEDAKNPHAYYATSTVDRFEAVMSGDGRWKLHFPRAYGHVIEPGKDGAAGKFERRQIELSLFDLKNDPGEQHNVIHEHPEVAEKMQRFADYHKKRFYED